MYLWVTFKLVDVLSHIVKYKDYNTATISNIMDETWWQQQDHNEYYHCTQRTCSAHYNIVNSFGMKVKILLMVYTLVIAIFQ